MVFQVQRNGWQVSKCCLTYLTCFAYERLERKKRKKKVTGLFPFLFSFSSLQVMLSSAALNLLLLDAVR